MALNTPPVLPLVQPGQTPQVVPPAVPQVTPQNVPPVTPQMATNQDVLQAGQNAAMQGFQTPTLDLTSEATRNLLKAPTQGYNPQTAVTAGMDQFNLNLAQQQEKLRRETAPSSHSGERLGELTDFAFRGAQEGAMTQQQLEQQANKYGLDALYNSLTQGRETSESERQRFETNIGALVDIRGAAEGERSQGSAQTWQTGERIATEAFEKERQRIDADIAKALQDNNYLRMGELEGLKTQNELKLMTQDLSDTEKKMRLDYELQAAMADGDVGRQQAILGYQALITADQMAAQYGYDQGLASLQASLQTAINNGDHVNAMAMLGAQQQFAAAEAVLDRQLESVKLQMEKAGMDYTMLENEIAAGRISPDDAVKFVQTQFPDLDLTAADPNAIYDELNRDYRVQQFQFAQTNPTLAEYDANGNFVGLKPEGAAQFNEFLNSAYYGEDGKILTQADITGLKGADRADSPKNAEYQTALANAPALSVSITNRVKNKLGGVPAEGSFVNVDGRLMQITRGVYDDRSGRNDDRFEILDVGTGVRKTFSGMSTGISDVASVNKLGDWARGLGSV